MDRLNTTELRRAVQLSEQIVERVAMGMPLSDAVEQVMAGRSEPDRIWEEAEFLAARFDP